MDRFVLVRQLDQLALSIALVLDAVVNTISTVTEGRRDACTASVVGKDGRKIFASGTKT